MDMKPQWSSFPKDRRMTRNMEAKLMSQVQTNDMQDQSSSTIFDDLMQKDYASMYIKRMSDEGSVIATTIIVEDSISIDGGSTAYQSSAEYTSCTESETIIGDSSDESLTIHDISIENQYLYSREFMVQ